MLLKTVLALLTVASVCERPYVLGDSDVLLKPIRNGSNPVAIVIVQGAQIPAKAYVPLANFLQEWSPYPLWIAIPAFPLDVAEPSASSGVERALKSLASAGMPSNTKLVAAGHSLGGAVIQDWVFENHDQVALQILMGAGLLRKYRNGTVSTRYPVPTLGISGTLDGLFRATRQAENIFHYSKDPSAPNSLQFPTVLIEGMSHMQFASGTPPITVKDNDLKPELEDVAAYMAVSEVITHFIAFTLDQNTTAKQALIEHITDTNMIANPLIKSQQLEATPHLVSPCNSDYPLPSNCPQYPRYPNGQQAGSNSPSCMCGTPWSEQAQGLMAGASAQFHVSAVDAVHPVSDIDPIHLPHVWNNCSSPSTSCTLSVTTVTEPIYSTLDGLDTGFSFISASELRTKLVSRQRLLVSAGATDVNFTATDVVPSICAEINNASWTWALSNMQGPAARRYQKIGVPMSFGKDIYLSNAGPVWIENPIEYQLNSDKTIMNVYSPCSHTPVDYSITAAAGFHYCKLVSPARAMEWIYIDSLRIRGGL